IFSQYNFNDNEKNFGNVVYTFKNQFMFFSMTDLNFGNVIFHNIFKIKEYYTVAYGIGNNSPKEDKYSYRFFQLDNYSEFGKNISNSPELYLAINNFFHKPNNKQDSLSIKYSVNKNHFANGIGSSFRYSDITDKFFRDGIILKSSYLFYPEFFGNLKQFSILETELGLYQSIRESAVNTLFSARFSFGHVHPEKLSAVGGTKILRGYPERRFIDKNMISAQTQYDLRLYKDISACIFISAGDVFDDFSDLSVKNTKLAFGGGFIYEFKGLIMRFETASSLEKDLQIIVTGIRVF
ncbi:MAG: hypothetical protein KKD38_00975, partial [Candidatus Delongbacteria bacterium]|nr:hypothetical protein [Candidatus Delongbacteria bacterium]